MYYFGFQGPGQVCLDYSTFVCMTCAGVHREFQHKCKGISMSKWTLEEVKLIENGGNEKDRATYLALWDPSKIPPPTVRFILLIASFDQFFVKPLTCVTCVTAQ